jgi:hypothetical protein
MERSIIACEPVLDPRDAEGLQGHRDNILNDLWAKVIENVRAAHLSFDNGLYNMAASRAYYAMFTAARVLLSDVAGVELEQMRRHTTVMRYFSSHFVRHGLCDRELGRAFMRASRLRGTADYDAQTISRDQAAAVIGTMLDFVAFAERLLPK